MIDVRGVFIFYETSNPKKLYFSGRKNGKPYGKKRRITKKLERRWRSRLRISRKKIQQQMSQAKAVAKKPKKSPVPLPAMRKRIVAAKEKKVTAEKKSKVAEQNRTETPTRTGERAKMFARVCKGAQFHYLSTENPPGNKYIQKIISTPCDQIQADPQKKDMMWKYLKRGAMLHTVRDFPKGDPARTRVEREYGEDPQERIKRLAREKKEAEEQKAKQAKLEAEAKILKAKQEKQKELIEKLEARLKKAEKTSGFAHACVSSKIYYASTELKESWSAKTNELMAFDCLQGDSGELPNTGFQHLMAGTKKYIAEIWRPRNEAIAWDKQNKRNEQRRLAAEARRNEAIRIKREFEQAQIEALRKRANLGGVN